MTWVRKIEIMKIQDLQPSEEYCYGGEQRNTRGSRVDIKLKGED